MLRALKSLDGGHERVQLSKLLRELHESLVIEARGELRLKRFPVADETV